MDESVKMDRVDDVGLDFVYKSKACVCVFPSAGVAVVGLYK